MHLEQLPDEIVQHLLYYISPEDTLCSFQVLSHRFRHLANESLLWKYYCQSSFQFWHPEHDFQGKLKCRASDVGWRHLYLLRKARNDQVSYLLDGILASKVGRLKRFEEICQFGYDAKDFLLKQCRAHEDLPDVLSRRYYSNSILDSIHRSVAVETWHNLQREIDMVGEHVTNRMLERVLGAFDMFVLHDQPGDIDDISSLLDDLTTQFRHDRPLIDEMTTRQKALALNQWLRANNLTGLQNADRNYRNLRNCFLGQALRHDQHDSIPIISSAIFCCMAERLELPAQCCAFPTHVHAIIFAEPGKTLDGVATSQPNVPREKMYLDPYGSDDEVSIDSLQGMLSRFGWQTSTDVFLAPVHPVSVAMRTARNIKATVARVHELRDQANPELTQLITGNDYMNMDAAHYAALWASLILMPVNVFEWEEGLEPFLRRFAKSWNEDAWLVKKFLCPIYDRFAPIRERLPPRLQLQGWDDPWEILGLVGEIDNVPPPVFPRKHYSTQSVPYKIGHVFRHKRYRWIGIINGWTDQGTRRLPMPHTVAIDETLDDSSDTDLPNIIRPRNQNFYTCLRTTGPERHVVAEDNIVLIDDPEQIPESIFLTAGRFFKRFDRATCTFVSNITEQYPDD